ncbi:MAG: hypothetical protein KGY45_01410 [Hadesarchaea archaeon]|nr:hypothetical protein [Hadesarchaea archaeon]
MKTWQYIYLIAVIICFLIGWFTLPILGVAFIWIFVITFELIDYLRELGRFEREVEEAGEEITES